MSVKALVNLQASSLRIIYGNPREEVASPQKYSIGKKGVAETHVTSFVVNYCAYMRDNYGIQLRSANASFQKKQVDSFLLETEEQPSIYEGMLCSLEVHPKDVQKVAFWIEAGAKPTTPTLLKAIEKKASLQILQLMINQGARPTTAVLNEAVGSGDSPEIVALLLSNNAKPTARTLQMALDNSFPTETILAFIKAGAKPDLKDDETDGFDKLGIEIALGAKSNPQIIRALIKAKGMISHRTLDIAMRCSRLEDSLEITRLLIEYGAPVTSLTVLFAIQNRETEEVVQMLFDAEPEDGFDLETIEKSSSNSYYYTTSSLYESTILMINGAIELNYSVATIERLLGLGLTVYQENLYTCFKAKSPLDVVAVIQDHLQDQGKQPSEKDLVEALKHQSPDDVIEYVLATLQANEATLSTRCIETAVAGNVPIKLVKTLIDKGCPYPKEIVDRALANEYDMAAIQHLISLGSHPSERGLLHAISHKFDIADIQYLLQFMQTPSSESMLSALRTASRASNEYAIKIIGILSEKGVKPSSEVLLCAIQNHDKFTLEHCMMIMGLGAVPTTECLNSALQLRCPTQFLTDLMAKGAKPDALTLNLVVCRQTHDLQVGTLVQMGAVPDDKTLAYAIQSGRSAADVASLIKAGAVPSSDNLAAAIKGRSPQDVVKLLITPHTEITPRTYEIAKESNRFDEETLHKLGLTATLPPKQVPGLFFKLYE